MERNRTVLVAGGDTRHGRAYVTALCAGGYRVRALVTQARSGRNDETGRASAAILGVEPVAVDLTDPEAIQRLMKDLDAVLIALDGRGPAERTVEERTTRTLIEAAATSQVAVVYSSRLHADRLTGVPGLDLKGRLELAARRSGAQVTILRPGMLMDVFDEPLRDRVSAQGVLSSAIALDAPVSYLAADDLGILAVLALEVAGLQGATLELGGPQALTFRELIPQLWRLTGHSVTYESLPLHEVRARSGDDEARLVPHINGVGYAVDMRPLLERVPVRLTTLAEYLAARGWSAPGWSTAAGSQAVERAAA